MATACVADVELLLRIASKIDWLSIAEAIVSGFADKSTQTSLDQLAKELAPLFAPALISAVGASAVPILGQLMPLLAPAIATAVLDYRGGDPDPMHDAQITHNPNPGDPAARL